ncbi:MAG: CRISPR-associated protein Csh1 [Thermotogaceae bacterium]|nr:CRISPR-associated protein Csh1 [Methanolobus sp.]MDN5338599.1 CRISPR-associated protein Csh1 [Thermotogaceae bacterium]
MIEAIKEIGEYALIKNNKNPENPIEVIVEDPASSPAYKHILAIRISVTESGFEYGGIQQEEYSKEKKEKYLYRKGSSKGIDLSPTSRITELEKTFNNKTIAWFKKIVSDKELVLEQEETQFLKKIYTCLVSNKDIISKDLNDKIKSFGKSENGILTLLVESEKDHLTYIGDINVFKKILVHYYSEDLYHSVTYKVDSLSYDQLCSVCKNKSEEVYGLVSTYAFYNVDKPGFVSGGFERSESWKNYPVCIKCALSLEAGKQYIEDYLKYNSYGFNYYIIPKLFHQKGNTEIYRSFEDYRKSIIDGNLSIKKEYGNLLSETEEDAFEMISKQSNALSTNLLFYEKTNAAFRILLCVEDVLPSKLRDLFETKKTIDKKNIFKNCIWNDRPLSFTFENIWYFYPRNREQDDSKHFLEIANNIFTSRKVDYDFLLKGIVNKIRKDFIKNNNTNLSVIKGFQLLDYLNTLNLLNSFSGGISVNKDSNGFFDRKETYIDKKASMLFDEFPDFFNQSAKKAVFLQGVLNQFLFDIQWQERKATPFRTKLQGLNLDEKLVKKLLPEIQNKLEEYGKNYYRDLEASISIHMLQSGDGWKLSKDEISFYYVLGMNLSYLFKKEGDKVNE